MARHSDKSKSTRAERRPCGCVKYLTRAPVRINTSDRGGASVDYFECRTCNKGFRRITFGRRR